MISYFTNEKKKSSTIQKMRSAAHASGHPNWKEAKE